MKNILGEQASPNPDYPQEITNVTGDVKIKVQNKNLLNIGTLLGGSLSIAGLYLNGGYSYFNITDNKVTVTTTQNYRGFVSDYIEIKENTRYFLSFETLQTGLNFEKYYSFYDENKENGSRNQTGLSPANAKYMRVSGTISTATTADFYNIQVEEGSVATDYAEHKEQTFTFPLGNEKLMLGDYLADDGIHHVRGQVVLDGSEDWSIAADYGFGTRYTEESGYIAFRVNINHSWGVKTTTDNGNTFSNIAKVFSWFTLQSTPQIGFCIIRYDNSPTTLWVAIPRSVASTVLDFKTFLQNRNMIIENEIEESVYQSNIVPYTSAQQEVYNQIKQALSYEEQTNIRGSSNGSNPIFSVEAYQNTKLILKEMATAIVALGGV